jgi:hypothetical protein
MRHHRHHRTFSRIFAGWLLLWLVTMTTAPPAQSPVGMVVPSAEQGADNCAHEDMQHTGHAAGSATHCPLCAHGATPPPILQAEPVAHAGDFHSELRDQAPLRLRTDVPPPARGPPALS